MYVRKVISTHAGKRCAKYLLVESVRTPQGPRQKVVCSLGDLHSRPAAEWLRLARKVEAALSEQSSLDAAKGLEVDKMVRKILVQGPRGAQPQAHPVTLLRQPCRPAARRPLPPLSYACAPLLGQA